MFGGFIVNKKKFICVIVASVLFMCMGFVCAYAAPVELITEPATEIPVVTETEPDETIPVTSDVVTETEATDTEPTYPTTTEVPSVPATTQVVTEVVDVETTAPTQAPTTEVTEDDQSSNPGNYVEPQNSFRPDTNRDDTTHAYERIDEEDIIGQVEVEDKNKDKNNNKNDSFLSVDGGDAEYDDFGFNKNEASVTDERNPGLFILSIVFWFVALGLATFAILFRPAKKAAGVSADKKESNNRKNSKNKKRR